MGSDVAAQPAMPGMEGGEADQTSVGDTLRDLLGGWWMAVPKKRRSKARRGQRNAPKYIR
jgi:hypothetical protein